jgi:small subunit ribosomal protein S20
MANSPSAKKRIRQNATRRARNRWRKDRVRTAMKDFRAALLHGEVDKAEGQLNALYKLLDQIGSTTGLHKNTASRYKSRLTARLNAARAAKKPAAA